MNRKISILFYHNNKQYIILKKYPKHRVEIFDRKVNKEALNFGYSPSYNYYKNGKLNTNR